MNANRFSSKLNLKAALIGGTFVLALVSPVRAGTRVELPAGSVDGLAAAVAMAGEYGTVVVKSGLHTESGTVPVGIPIDIVGEPGAVIQSGTSPVLTGPIAVHATLDIRGTEDVRVQGLKFRPTGEHANCALLIENSSRVQVLDNTITGFQSGLIVQYSEQATISGNSVSDILAYGIIIVNGASAKILQNTVSGAPFGIFASDRDGLASGNAVSGCYVGLMFCHLPAGVLDISGDVTGAHTHCSYWQAVDNVATGNSWGYEVIDGSHDNMLVNNAASNNSAYDIELAGDTSRYGFFAPASQNDVLIAGSQENLVVKDCGNNDVIRGHVNLVDPNTDPCF